MTRRIGLKVGLAGIIVLLFAGWLAAPAGAHAGNQSYLYVDVTDDSLSGRLDIPINDLEQALDIDLGDDRTEVLESVETNSQLILGYLDDHFDIGEVGTSWEVTFNDVELLALDNAEADSNYVLFPFTVTVEAVEVPRVLDVTFDPFFDEIDGRDSLLLVRNDWKAGVFDNGGTALVLFDDGSRTQAVDLGATSTWKNFRASIDLGVDHIKTGPDHILFVMVLVLPSVLIFAAGWRPTPTFAAALWRVLKVVTMFTLAHSITFTLAGLGVLPLPSARITESIIAASIAAAALHNIRPIAPNKEWLISFAFGLFHGIGFASLVDGLDVDKSTQLVSLLGRNVGIEIGQSVVVLVTFPMLFLLRRSRYYMPIFVAASAALTLVSLGWMIERVFETDLGVSGWVDPIVKWPRSLFGAIVLTAVAAAMFVKDRNDNNLLAVHDDEGTSDESDPGTDGDRQLVEA